MFIGYIWLNHKPYDNFESHQMPFCGATWKRALGACHMYIWENHAKKIKLHIKNYYVFLDLKQKIVHNNVCMWKIIIVKQIILFWIFGFFSICPMHILFMGDNEKKSYVILLKSSWWGLQICFRPHLNGRFAHKVINFQNLVSPIFGNFGTPTWESWDKMTFGC
jgi:hypothetical protein